MKDNPYLQFIRFSLDDTQELFESVKCIDWKAMMVWAEKQAIVGIIYHGIEKARENLSIPYENLMQWIGYSQTIVAMNRLVNNRCVEICQEFSSDGFETCILKGQGNALSYPGVLSRTPGDIDVWVMPGERLRDNGSRFNVKEIIRYVKKWNPKGRALYHHIDFGEYKGVEVEVHYRPSFLFNPVHNYRLQKWFIAHGSRLMVELPENAGRILVPSREFNVVFQLCHVYNHLLHEGIGLKQVVDYYYLLKSNQYSTNDTTIQYTLWYLGLEKIAGAMMWVLNEILGLPGEYLIAQKDEKRGRVLIKEIMKDGNFGQYDVDNQKTNGAIRKNLQRIKRDIRMMQFFPSECLWEPVFRLYHFLWRITN